MITKNPESPMIAKPCQHNQRWGYNESKMIYTERCRARMEQALATTEAGQQRLAVAEDRMNQRLAKEIEEADARPERGARQPCRTSEWPTAVPEAR